MNSTNRQSEISLILMIKIKIRPSCLMWLTHLHWFLATNRNTNNILLHLYLF